MATVDALTFHTGVQNRILAQQANEYLLQKDRILCHKQCEIDTKIKHFIAYITILEYFYRISVTFITALSFMSSIALISYRSVITASALFQQCMKQVSVCGRMLCTKKCLILIILHISPMISRTIACLNPCSLRVYGEFSPFSDEGDSKVIRRTNGIM